jgi:hypothetical protein
LSATFATIKLSENCTLSKRLRLAIDAHLFPDGDNRITNPLDGALQLAFCHSKMSKLAPNVGLILHGNMAAVALALAGKYIAHKSSHPCLKQ